MPPETAQIVQRAPVRVADGLVEFWSARLLLLEASLSVCQAGYTLNVRSLAVAMRSLICYRYRACCSDDPF